MQSSWKLSPFDLNFILLKLGFDFLVFALFCWAYDLDYLMRFISHTKYIVIKLKSLVLISFQLQNEYPIISVYNIIKIIIVKVYCIVGSRPS